MNIDVGRNDDGYFLIININNYKLTADEDIIKYFNLSEDFWYSNLKKFDCEIFAYGIFFKNYNNIIKAKQWVENNLDYFLILRKLGGL